MKYEKYGWPNYARKDELELDKIPIYAGCTAGEFGCGCLGMCQNIIDYLTKEEIEEKNVQIYEN